LYCTYYNFALIDGRMGLWKRELQQDVYQSPEHKDTKQIKRPTLHSLVVNSQLLFLENRDVDILDPPHIPHE